MVDCRARKKRQGVFGKTLGEAVMHSISRSAMVAGFGLLISTLAAGSAAAQVSLVGEWSPRYHEDQPERIPGPELGDYTGLPINEGARLAADTWNASRLTLPEHQCKGHLSPYLYHGPLHVGDGA